MLPRNQETATIVVLFIAVVVYVEVFSPKTRKNKVEEARLMETTVALQSKGKKHLGSGFLVDATDLGVVGLEIPLVVTNAHVAKPKSDKRKVFSSMQSNIVANIVLHNGHEMEGRVIAWDIKKDVALVKPVDGSKIPFAPAKLGTFDSLNWSDRVYVCGAPKGYRNTITKGRIVNILYKNETKKIMHDALTANGSSGSPLYDRNGCVIGFHKSRLNGSNGGVHGFAIPADLALSILSDVLCSSTDDGQQA